MKYSVVTLLFMVFLMIHQSLAKEKAPECEVCVEMLMKVSEGFTAEDKKSLAAMEEKIDSFCGSKEKLKATHEKLCYYITPIKREITQPYKNGVPVDRICKRLQKKSAEICAIRPPVKIEKGVTDYSKLRVKQLKKILGDRGVTCKNCLEKSEFVQKCKDTEHLEL